MEKTELKAALKRVAENIAQADDSIMAGDECTAREFLASAGMTLAMVISLEHPEYDHAVKNAVASILRYRHNRTDDHYRACIRDLRNAMNTAPDSTMIYNEVHPLTVDLDAISHGRFSDVKNPIFKHCPY